MRQIAFRTALQVNPKVQNHKIYDRFSSNSPGLVEIVYYTDPLCCWSWGFEPQWRKLRYEFASQVTWRYCMGGLIPAWNNYHDVVNLIHRPIQMGPVWMDAGHVTGMPVYNRIWMEDPPASSYPACIAVKCAFLQSPDAGETYLRMLREAVMIEGHNIASLPVLESMAAKLSAADSGGFSFDVFNQDMKNENGLEAFRLDIAEVQQRNISRFPSLIFRAPQKTPIIITGYRPYSVLLSALTQIAPGLLPVRKANDVERYKQYWGSLTNREIGEALSQENVGG